MLILLLLGLFVGLVMGLTGAGGGILALPLLLGFMHLSFIEAVPIAMLATGMTAGIGALLGLRAGQVRYRAAVLMALAGMLVAPFGIWLAQRLDHSYLSMMFAIILLLVACRTLCGRNPELPGKDLSQMPCLVDSSSGRFIWNGRCSLGLGFAGTLAGLLSGLIGVGGGFVLVPALQRISVLSMVSVMSTALAVVFLVSVTVIAGHIVMGHVIWSLAIPFALSSMIGVILGRQGARKLQSRQLQIGFALLMVAAASTLIYRALV
jgi:uncharacterized membrane protein YfcA